MALWPRFLVSVLLLAGFAAGVPASASGPHWVAGAEYFSPAVKGNPVVWTNGQVSYYMDQGALSGSVSNSQAASAVASAAAVWAQVPTAAVAITQGGSLSEDVNGSNVTANTPAGTGAVLPADAQPSATGKPVAVVLDADGSVIDAIYGPGSSDPGFCTQNGVIATVDSFAVSGSIAHALILINGRCATSAGLDGLLQYQMVRAWGRVLGLDWSQVNEAMWPSHPTTDGLTGWPLMHPLEYLCTGSDVSCLPNQLTLRTDDVASLNQLYPVTAVNAGSWSGKTQTAPATITVTGTISFRDGQGMQGVNVVLTPLNGSTPDVRYTASAVSGAYFRGSTASAVTGATDAQGNPYGRFGTDDAAKEGYFVLAGVPLPPGVSSAAYQLSLEPINPLYIGQESVGPYSVSQVAPSGTVQTVVLGSLSAGSAVTQNFVMADSARGTVTDDGLEASPNSAEGNGEWIARLVGYGHTGWFTFHARANRYFTVQAQALDEQGLATNGKAGVLIGLWSGSDAIGSAPDLATTVPFTGYGVGMSTLSAYTDTDGDIRLAYADARGDGRPDFNYRARVLYADSVFPARLTLNGGTTAIQGQGFRPGMTVTLNGVNAAVTSVTPTEITAVAAAVSAPTGTLTLEVQDPQTLAFTEILDGLSYDAQGTDGLRLISGPSGTQSQGVPVPMMVQAVAADGKTPAGNVRVSFTVASGSASMSCGSSPCTAMTNGDGMAVMMVAPQTTQSTAVTATLSTGANVTAEFNGGTPPQIAATNTLYVAIGAQVSWTPIAVVLSNGSPVQGSSVLWTGGAGARVGTVTSTSNAAGFASTTVTAGPLAAGSTASVYACEAGAGPCATFTISAVHAELASLLPVSGVGQSLAANGTPMPVTLQVVDGAGQPLAGGQVNFYQQLDSWQPPCPSEGRCPAAQQLGSQSSTAQADANGLVTLTPMSNGGQAVVLHVQATTGQQGSLVFTIQEHP